MSSPRMLPPIADPIVAAIFFVALMAPLAADDQRRVPVLVMAALVLATCAPIAVRRRHPWPALVGMTTGALGIAIAAPDFTNVATSLFLLIVVGYTAGRDLDPPAANWGALISVGLVVGATVIDHLGSVSDVIFPSLVAIVSWLVGRSLRTHARLTRELAEQTAQLEAQRERGEAEAAAEERARIARELHDVVAHSVSVMVVQSGAARRVLDRDSAAAIRALGAVEDTGRVALGELRRLLGLMRDESSPAGLEPQPGLAGVPGLVEQARAAGLPTALDVSGAAGELPAGIDLAAYRVIQEALTNALKHAAGAHATVALRWTEDALELEIADTGGVGALTDRASEGHGLVGMRERVALYGGELHAAARPGGGFVVRARLPRPAMVAA